MYKSETNKIQFSRNQAERIRQAKLKAYILGQTEIFPILNEYPRKKWEIILSLKNILNAFTSFKLKTLKLKF